MSSDSPSGRLTIKTIKTLIDLNIDLVVGSKKYQAAFHGDDLLGDKQNALTGTLLDIRNIFVWRNTTQICRVVSKWFTGQGLDVSAFPSKANHGPMGSSTPETYSNTDGFGSSTYRLSTRE